MQFDCFPVTAFAQNCSLLYCETTGEAALVDPGGDAERLLAAVAQRRLTLTAILLTHGHLDHVGAVGELKRRTGVEIIGPHRDDRFLIEALDEQAALFGLPTPEAFLSDRWLSEGETVSVGRERLAVLQCPGHTPGHVVFHSATSRLAWVGDVLFHGGIGRTDFPRGNQADLLRSVVDKLWPLGDDIRFVPGHGPMSTFGEERRSNPFVADRVLGRPGPI